MLRPVSSYTIKLTNSQVRSRLKILNKKISLLYSKQKTNFWEFRLQCYLFPRWLLLQSSSSIRQQIAVVNRGGSSSKINVSICYWFIALACGKLRNHFPQFLQRSFRNRNYRKNVFTVLSISLLWTIARNWKLMPRCRAQRDVKIKIIKSRYLATWFMTPQNFIRRESEIFGLMA